MNNHEPITDKVKRIDENYSWLIRLIVAGVLGYVAVTVTYTKYDVVKIEGKLELYDYRLDSQHERLRDVEKYHRDERQ